MGGFSAVSAVMEFDRPPMVPCSVRGQRGLTRERPMNNRAGSAVQSLQGGTLGRHCQCPNVDPLRDGLPHRIRKRCLKWRMVLERSLVLGHAHKAVLPQGREE
ncbi:hypothetical protein JZ751_006052 [Albula glossodonta]|uniref:Uncharacterized protein n=1 Tax=Albula glossodonta TaxID=121402 RepID=A0A8T2P3I5_9TELE|nr:hypothetical protein JZ751_006052 [Albula glossodonta]